MGHGLLVGLALWLAGRAILHAVTPAGEDPRVTRVIRWALALKLLAAPVYLYLIGRFYDDVADYTLYHEQGQLVLEQLRRGQLALDVGPVIGLGATYAAVGAVYLAVGVSLTAGSLVFSWLAFWGLYLFYRAARVGVPELDARRYCSLLFFLPTTVFWSSTIGKDALMVLALGLAALGAALLLNHQRGGSVTLAAGMAASAMVRPHVGLMLLAGVVVAYLVRARPERATTGIATRLVVGVLLLAGGVVLAGRVATYLSVDRLDADAINDRLAEVSAETGEGSRFATTEERGYESSFEPSGFRSPAEFPIAVVTVLFRPFPVEAGNLPARLASFEGTALIGLAFASRRRLREAMRLWRTRPYLAAVTVYAAAFCYVFASVGNFGLLARQRAQLLPLVLVLLALPAAGAKRRLPAGQRRL